ncbi:cytochrome c oxidase assembly factor 6 homolog isoform X2 [Eumetopias jubatus]|uniref:cytochrome c oxidase assembly factor 6 homolog isoform X2 n=1 Tax=Eumetopias jubatus TaxID=34886 RepID=UPI00101666D5|nr:cytochrome c oxidase assembly factor 6 homolog isoform X2 [Eumetopias jubatus]
MWPRAVADSARLALLFCTPGLSPLGMAAPSMKERQACWGARDEYWKCLDENTEDASQCKKLRSSFESSCPQQWGCSRSACSLPTCVLCSGIAC